MERLTKQEYIDNPSSIKQDDLKIYKHLSGCFHVAFHVAFYVVVLSCLLCYNQYW